MYGIGFFHLGLLHAIDSPRSFLSVEIDDAAPQPRMEESPNRLFVIQHNIFLQEGEEKILQDVFGVLFAPQPTKCSDVKFLPELIIDGDNTLPLVYLFQYCTSISGGQT